jgi:hypothetical protein
LFFLTDGIYKSYSRFAKPTKEPISKEQKRYKSWPEGSRKDVEKDFVVLKKKLWFLERGPVRFTDIKLLQGD